MRHFCGFVLALLSVSFISLVRSWAQDTTKDLRSQPTSQSESLAFLKRAGDLRRHFDEKGIGLSLLLVNDWSNNFREGSSSAGSFDRYSLDVSFTLDTNKSLGWNGGTASIRLKNHIGENGSDYVGDAQGFSNIDDVSRTRLYEFWYEQKLAGDKVRFKFGKIDANSEFALVRVAGDFLNSSMGYSPTILALPTYPEPKPSVDVFLAPVSHYQVSAGVFRTATNGNMLLIEGGRDWRMGDRELAGRSSFGVWRLTGPIACFAGDDMESTQGFYAVAEQALWKNSPGQKELDAFLQFGLANGEVSRFTRHIGGGIVFQSLFAARAHDALGIAATSARFTDDPDAGYQYDAELAVETYYKVSLGKFVSVVPDVQFIHHPGGLRSLDDAFVFTPRLIVSF